jgi:hypothetical protein
MRPFNVGLVALLLMLVSACDGRGIPNSVSSATAPATIVLLGQVTDRTTSAPVSGAIVSLNGYQTAITDSSGNYSFGGWGTMTFVEADNYATDYRYIGGTPHNVHLYPIRRITAGDSTSVTVAPDDTLCVNNMQDSPELGPNYLCRSVRVVAPSAGVMTLEALSTTNGPPPLLEVEIVTGGLARLENPTSIPVTAGTEVVAHVETPVGSASSQTFTLNTSMRPR